MSIKISGGGGGGAVIPGLAVNPSDPQGIAVAGGIQAGDPTALLEPSFNRFQGMLDITSSVGTNVDGDDVFRAVQSNSLTGDSASVTCEIYREGVLNGHQYTVPTLEVQDRSGSTAVVASFSGSANAPVRVGQDGGLAMFGTAIPTAPRTLAQATITAITDANAKAAVQACANALADMGILTLT